MFEHEPRNKKNGLISNENIERLRFAYTRQWYNLNMGI